jgi:hypothetical protein
MSASAVLVHEYVTGGGPLRDPPPPLARDALAIARAAVADFRAWGRLPVVATLGPRSAGADLPADEVVTVCGDAAGGGDRAGYEEALTALARRCGAALLVAPETGGTLERLTARLESAGVRLLGSSSAAVSVAADKGECARRFAAAGLPVPRTLRVAPAGAAEAARRLGHPVVVKPVCGAGGEGVALARTPRDLDAALACALAATKPSPDGSPGRELLLQEYVPGTAASVSLLARRGGSRALSLNLQDVRPGIPFTCGGTEAGVAHPRAAEAFALARRAAALIPGLLGYVGVDLVLGDTGCTLVEVNARLTTSYAGIVAAEPGRLAAALWAACAPAGSAVPRGVVA